MGVLELASEAFASERAMLRSMLGVEGCAALGEVREAAARRLDQFVMNYCDGPTTRTAQNGSTMVAAGTNPSQLQAADREGDRAPQEWRGGRGGEEERWGRADEARGRREDRGRADDRARGDDRGRPVRSRSRSRSRERAPAPLPALDRGGFNPRSLPNGGGSASAAASVIKPGDWACPVCGVNVFASKVACFKCGTAKVSLAKGPSKGREEWERLDGLKAREPPGGEATPSQPPRATAGPPGPRRDGSSAWRTKPCKFFASPGGCTAGASCSFLHAGRCSGGDGTGQICTLSHSGELQPYCTPHTTLVLRP